MDGRISFDKKKPGDLDHFRYDEYEFCRYRYSPALGIGYPVTEQKAADPNDKCYHREFPEVNKRNGDKL